jgi:phosphatidylglycerophosphate synthase
MLDSLLRRASDPLLALLGARLSHLTSANALTLSAFVCGVAALPDIRFQKYFFALGLLILRGLFDVLDGAVARVRGPTTFGAYLDQVLSLVVSAGVPFAFALAEPDRALAAMFLLFGLVVRAGSAVAVKASGTGIVDAALDQTRMLVGKSELFIAFALACIFPLWFSIIAYIVGILCFVAAGSRVATAATAEP